MMNQEKHEPQRDDGVTSPGPSGLLPASMSLTSIVFWRHVVGMVLVVMVAPPYGVSRTPTEFLGATLGTLLLPLITSSLIVGLGLLFFTAKLKGNTGSLFIKIAWIMTFLGIFFINYGMQSIDVKTSGQFSAPTNPESPTGRSSVTPPPSTAPNYLTIQRRFVLKLAGSGSEEHYFLAEVTLAPRDNNSLSLLMEREPELQHHINAYLMSKKYVEISAPDGQQKTAEGLRDALNKSLGGDLVREVLFTQFIAQ